MKTSLTLKLTLYFSAAVLTLIIVVGAFFTYLYQQRSEKIYVSRLTSIAVALAQNVGENEEIAFNFPPLPPPEKPPINRNYYTRRTFNANEDRPRDPKFRNNERIARQLRDLNRFSQGEVWIVDKKTRSFSVYGKENSVSYDKLPEKAEEMLENVFLGENSVSRNFSPLLSAPSISVGVPIKDKDGNTKGALVLHSATGGLQTAQDEAYKLLAAALAVGTVLTLLLSAILAKTFVKPLKQMEAFAKDLAEEKYFLRSGIEKTDEIGSLAKSLDMLAIRLEAIKNEKERLQKMRQDFLTGVSHELKTPITVIRGLLEMMTEGLANTEEQRENCLKLMQKNILGLGRLVQDLFELSRLQNSDFTIEKNEINLKDALNDALQATRQIGTKKDVEVIATSNGEPIILNGDYGRLRQMFLAVLDNAVKFSPIGGKIEVSVATSDNLWQISVKDKGEGIAKEDLPHIFEKFHSQKSQKNDDGTGLGLAIAKEIANRHNIKISCQSEKGEGAEFIFSQSL